MRPRRKQNLTPRLDACAPLLLSNAKELHAQEKSLRTLFPNPEAPLMLEIGCGKGRFIRELAARNPQNNYIAMEREPHVAVIAVEQAFRAESAQKNLLFLLEDAELLREFLFPGELTRIYINFCDPWPKRRQYQRRLTYRERLSVYKTLLGEAGEIHFKTDNYMLYHFSTFEFDSCMTRYFTTTNLHASPLASENIATEYEEHFSSLGQPIYSIHARK